MEEGKFASAAYPPDLSLADRNAQKAQQSLC